MTYYFKGYFSTSDHPHIITHSEYGYLLNYKCEEALVTVWFIEVNRD